MPIYKEYDCRSCGKHVRRANTSGIYCSNTCQQEYQHKEFIDSWLKGENPKAAHNGINRYASKHIYRWFKSRFDSCQLCGVREWNGRVLTLQLDHIDGDRKNAEYSNLRLICPNCHSQTETYAGKAR